MKQAVFYDFCETLSTEMQFMPLLRTFAEPIQRHYGIPITDYFRVLCAETDIGLGSSEQILIDIRKGILPHLTKADLRAFGKDIELAPGLPDWFEAMNNHAATLGVTLEHHCISAGVEDLIFGSQLWPYFDSVHAGRYLENEAGIYRLARVIEPGNKTECIKSICSGDLYGDVPVSEYSIRYDSGHYIFDGLSDRRKANFARQIGGFTYGVYTPEDKPNFDRCVDRLTVHESSAGPTPKYFARFILPRDYRENSALFTQFQQNMERVAKRTCSFDYQQIHALTSRHHVNGDDEQGAKDHVSTCEDCQFRLHPVTIVAP